MNRNLRNAKIKRYIEILEEYCVKDYIPLNPLKGNIWDDREVKKTGENLSDIKQRSGISGARKNFHLEGEFKADKKEGSDTVLFLELGNSKSLEALSFLYGPEAIVSIDGAFVSGMDPNHSCLLLDQRYLDGEVHTLTLEGWTGIKEELYEIGRIGICYRRSGIYRLVNLCKLCYETAQMTQREELYLVIADSLRHLDLYEPLGGDFEKSAEKAYKFLSDRLSALNQQRTESAALCGHGHLDLAWLWRTSQAKKKGARTFLNVLGIMDRHSQFRYSQTQAQLYQWMEKEYPEIFQRVKRAVREGKWEILGGMWVEPDCNITGAESLVRQFLLFDSYMQEKFETAGSPVVWLPDTFGFCGQLPQIMKKAGYEYFATAKLTWNQYNKMPSEYFLWEGIDGTRVFSHIVSISKPGWWGATYSADLTPKELISTVGSLEKKELHNEFLMAYGMGDGGGGPTEEMAVRAELLSAHKIPGLPKVRYSTFGDFFEKMKREAAEKLPVWNGELYFELHRGTYTSQAGMKRDNRLCEAALHLAEFAAAFAAETAGYPYPDQCLRQMWEIVCLNQFHDILPGSSIGEVYQDAKKDHEKVLRECRDITKEAVDRLAVLMPPDTKAVVINSTSFPQSGMIRLPFIIPETQCLKTEEKVWESVCQDGGTYVKVDKVPPCGFLTLSIDEMEVSGFKEHMIFAGLKKEIPKGHETLGNTRYLLFNQYIWVEMDENGDVIQYFDRETEREIVRRDQKFFQWKLYEDRPADWDAWDLDEDYREKNYRAAVLISAEKYEIPGMLAGFCMRKKIGRSEITQRIFVDNDSKSLMMDIKLDYQEDSQLLRIDCPVEIHNSYAEYGSQFGSVLRSTHYNTSWDEAKFESCMHKWADYSEGDYGVSVLCDNKYGVSIHEGIISIAVSKSAGFPDPRADRGIQEFKLFILPHEKNEKRMILQKAYLLTNPLEVFPVRNGSGEISECSMVHCDSDNMIIETIKRAEDNNGTIVRAYECNNTRGRARFIKNPESGIEKAALCSILEKDEERLPINSRGVEVFYHPYEILTIRMQGGEDESINNV